MTDDEFALAYRAALNIVAPLAGLPIELQMNGFSKHLTFWED